MWPSCIVHRGHFFWRFIKIVPVLLLIGIVYSSTVQYRSSSLRLNNGIETHARMRSYIDWYLLTTNQAEQGNKASLYN